MKDVQPTKPVPTAIPELDQVDRMLLQLLADDARMPNNALADAVGIAPSTCLNRVRLLRQRGVIRGFHADVDSDALGLPIQAFVAVRMRSTARTQIGEMTQRLAELPGVLNVYFMAGADDFQVHVACASSAALRDFVVDNLSASDEVALTETNLIFEHVAGRPARDPARDSPKGTARDAAPRRRRRAPSA